MRRSILSVLLLFLLAVPAAAQVKVKGDPSYKPYAPIVLKAADVSGKQTQFLWDVSAGAQVVEAADTLYVWAPPGSYQVRLTAIDFDAKKVERAAFAFSVEGQAPTPAPPPTPGPAPSPVSALKVLILYESSALASMPRAQEMVLRGQAMRDWLQAHCTDSPVTQSRKAWFMLDKDADTSGIPDWQKWAGRPRASVPWIIVGSGDTVAYEGPLPADTAATIALLSKFVPAKRRAA